MILSASLEDSLDQAINEVATTFTVKDIVPPTASIIPANGSQNIPTNLNISITFSEPIRKKDNGIITGSDIAAGLVVLKANDANGSPYTFQPLLILKIKIVVDPLFDFSASSIVYVGLSEDIEDFSDNLLVPTSSTFKTGVPDVTPPQVVRVFSTTPDGNYTAGDRIEIFVEFDEEVVADTGNVALKLKTRGDAPTAFASEAKLIGGMGTKPFNLSI